MLTRRGFFTRLLAAAGLAVTAGHLTPATVNGRRPCSCAHNYGRPFPADRAAMLHQPGCPWVADAWAERKPDLGVSVRYVRQFDITSHPIDRLDVLYGVGIIRPDLACRISA